MKNSITGIRISEEMKRLIAHGKKRADISNYPEIEEYIRTNKTANRLVEELSDPQYPSIDEQYKENQVNRFFQIIHKKQIRRQLRRRVAISLSTAAALIALSFLIIPTNRREEFQKIETFTTNNTPTLIMEDGSSIDLSKVTPDSLKKIEPRTTIAHNRPVYNLISIPHHYTYNITLDDGTEVYLNACTELKYPNTFSDDARVVELKGEAFFKVTKSSKPFIIKTDDTTVKVYGTSFNIFASPKITETILLEGSIGITQNNGNKEVKILPNQRHTLRDGFVKIDSIDAANSIGWIKNEFNFTQIPIQELLTKLSEWYGVSFEVVLSESELMTIDISSPRSMKIEQLIEVMELSTNLQFIKEAKNKYIVKLK